METHPGAIVAHCLSVEAGRKMQHRKGHFPHAVWECAAVALTRISSGESIWGSCLTLFRMTKDEKGLAFFKGLLL